jgi:hypothetical protein
MKQLYNQKRDLQMKMQSTRLGFEEENRQKSYHFAEGENGQWFSISAGLRIVLYVQ